MMDGMGSMSGLGWLVALLLLGLLIAAVVAVIRLLVPANPGAADARAGKITLVALAVFGAVALAAILALGLMVLWGMTRGALGF